MHGADFEAADVLGVLEGVFEDAFGGFAGDEFDGLDDAVYHYMFDAGVFAFGVFADEDGVDVVVGGFVAVDALAGPHVGEEVESAAEGEVERDVAFADRGGEGAFEGDVVAFDGGDGFVGDGLLAVFEDGVDGDGFPFDWCSGGGEDVFDRDGDLASFYEWLVAE